MKKSIRLCQEPAGPVSRLGTHGPWALSRASGPLGKWLLSRLGWMTHFCQELGVVLRVPEAAEV